MAKHHNPKIVTSGLVFAYDMGNTQKSWKGKPTTNHIPNPYASWNGSSFVLGYNYANLGATYTYKTGVSNPVNAPGVMEYFTGTTGYKYFSIDSTAVPTTGNYTFSYYARVLNAASSNLGNSQLWRANGTDRTVTGNWNPTITSDWTKFSTTGPVEAGTILQYFPVHGGSITGGLYVQYCGFQLESGDISTPLVIGTRSNAQSIIDLTGNNTVTVSDLTYAADNTFSFDGSNDNLNCGNNGAINFGTGSFTVSAWFKRYSNATTNLRLLSKAAGSDTADAANAGFCFFGSNSGVSFGVNPTAARTIINAASYSVNQWVNVVGLVERGVSMRTYQNGSLVASATAPSGSVSGTTSLFVGDNVGSNLRWQGEIPIVNIYNRALTAEEILQNFNALRGRFGI